MVKIAFWDNSLCERGTTISLYDYAYYNKHLLLNESIILYNLNRIDNNNEVIEKFKKEFEVIGLNDFSDVDNILKYNNCDILYIIKAGNNEGHLSKVIKNVVHCVFNCNEPHGSVYAAISPYVKGYKKKVPVVPHMINLPNHDRNMREELNIPKDAIVYGRHGGYEQFDINYVHKIVYDVAKNHENIYFLFVNTKVFCKSLPNIIHIDKIIDLDKKVEFINTCDAMLWARNDGETFGLSIAEFSSKNKPVIATPNLKLNPKVDKAHMHFLGNKGIWYNETNLYNILTTFITSNNINDIRSKDWNAFKDYSPEKVIKIFEKVFINSPGYMDTTIVKFMDKFNIEIFKNDSLAEMSILKNIEWEPHITKFVKYYNKLYNIQNIIDIGSNFGYHTLLFSKEVKEKVFSFEPQKQNFKILQRNINRNNIKNVVLYNYACGDINCDVKMPIIQNTKNQMINMGDFTPNIINGNSYTITKSIILDEMDFPQIDLIKIDVQGWEKKVLNGAINLLKKYKPTLIVEFEVFQLVKTNTSCEELFDFIRNNNYYIFYLDYEYPSDHICVHNDNIDKFRNDFKEFIFSHTTYNDVNSNIKYGINEKIMFT